MQESKHPRLIYAVLYTLAVLAALWLAAKFVLPCLLPFLFALLTAWLAEPVIRYLNSQLNIRRGFASFISILLLVLSLVGVVALIVTKLIYEAAGFVRELPQLCSGLPSILGRINLSIERYVSTAPKEIQEYLDSAMDSVADAITALPVKFSSFALDKLSALAGSTPKIVLSCAVYIVGSFFISRTFPDIRHFLVRQIPPRFRKLAQNLKRDLLDSMGLWLKAQFILMCITFCELTFALTLMHIHYAIIIAIMIAVIDALPVFGTGTVLIPWAGISVLGGEAGRAIGLIITYGVITLARSFLEPKIVGGSFGINPAAALLATYSGFRLAGVWGMVLFPVGLMMLKQMNDKGYVKLWK